jgi:hypothetical protein
MRRSVVLLPSIMKGTKGRHQSYLKRVFLLICIIAALCFSAGEGLRLTPFPAGNVAGITLQDGQLDNNGTRETSPTKYGPIDLPKRTQARSKHKVFDVDCLSAPLAVNPSSRFCNVLTVGDATTVASLQLISRVRDRAPPFSLTS